MRPSLDEYYMEILPAVARRTTCARRATSTLLVDEEGRLLASGYNGVPKNIVHCTEVPCEGIMDQSGDTSRCLAVHAEVNCLLQAGDRLARGYTLYTLTEPCFGCAKLICNTNIKRVLYRDDYPDKRALALFEEAEIKLIKCPSMIASSSPSTLTVPS